MTDERKGMPSASGFERIVLCPGSWQMEKGLPDQTSDDAESGTRIHAALSGESVELDPQEEDTVEICKSLAAGLVDKTLDETKPIYLVERRLWFEGPAQGIDLVSAKVDMLVMADRRALIVDFKTGRGEVEHAVGNHQLMVAAVCAAHEYDLDRVFVAIVQPWVSPQVTTAVYEGEQLASARGVIIDAIRSSLRDNAPLIPGEKQCKYCKAKTTCPAVKAEVGKLAVMTLTANNNEVLTPQDMAKLLAQCSMASAVIQAARAKAKEMLEAGLSIPGWKLSPGRKTREVTKPDVVFERAKGIGIAPEKFMACVGVGLGDLEKLTREATGLKGEKLKEQVSALLDGAVEVKQSARSLEKE